MHLQLSGDWGTCKFIKTLVLKRFVISRLWNRDWSGSFWSANQWSQFCLAKDCITLYDFLFYAICLESSWELPYCDFGPISLLWKRASSAQFFSELTSTFSLKISRSRWCRNLWIRGIFLFQLVVWKMSPVMHLNMIPQFNPMSHWN
jgi:hypothetical protein